MTAVIPANLKVNKSSLIAPQDTSHYFGGLDGLRLFSAYGVLLTHVAFQTGHSRHNLFDLLLGRLDLAVAVFFALSGFLLWRPYLAKIYNRTIDTRKELSHTDNEFSFPNIIRYYLHRILRIIPAYWLVVICAFFFLPSLHYSSWHVIWANLGLYQIYQPLTLVDGLTQMWSLDVEMSFYFILPLIALIFSRLYFFPLRIIILSGSVILSILWWTVPVGENHLGFDLHSNLAGYWAWFGIGLILAELYALQNSPKASMRIQKFLQQQTKLLITLIFCASCYGIVISPWGGEPGFFTPTLTQRILRLTLGAAIAYALLARQIFANSVSKITATSANGQFFSPRNLFSLSNPLISAVGKWAYGIFLWHLLILSAIMSLNYIFPFQGHFIFLAISTGIISTLMGGLSYIFIEYPSVHWTKRIEKAKFLPNRIDFLWSK